MKKGGFLKKTLRDVPLDGAVVLVRADYNVPLENGEIRGDHRIVASLPTLRELIKRRCKVVIISHLGRPEGAPVAKYSLAPVSVRLGELLGKPVQFVNNCVGDAVQVAVKNAAPGSVTLLENLRFHKEEEQNDTQFAERLVKDSGAQYFVQDGFGVVHRAHASTSAVTQFVPSVAGLLLEKEYLALTGVMEHPERPMVAVLGGAKISDKLPLVKRFISIADTVIIGGAMANNFLRYRHYPVGKSKVEDGVDNIVADIYAAAEVKVGKDKLDEFLIIPEDVAVGDTVDASARRAEVDRRNVLDNEYILDVGASTMATVDEVIEKARTVVWNGTMGYSELSQFAHGSARLALALATHPDITSVIGGGDTADFVLGWDVRGGESFSHVSTGGGASLELMSGEPMPGITVLMDA